MKVLTLFLALAPALWIPRSVAAVDAPQGLAGVFPRSLQAELPSFNETDLLSREHDFVVVYLSNALGASDTGIAAQVDLTLRLVSEIHLNGDGPQYHTVHVSDNPEETVEAVQALYDSGVRIFVGPETSSQAVALADWAESEEDPKDGVVFFTFWASNPGLGDRPSIIQLIPSDIHLVDTFLAMRTYTPGRNYISIIHDDGVYATGIAKLLNDTAHHLLVTTCQIPTNQVQPNEAYDCAKQVAQASPPEQTMVLLITSGVDTREMLEAAYAVYSELGYSGNSNGDVMWIGGDTIAYDVSVFDDAHVETATWKGGQIVNLNAATPGQGQLRSYNDLALKWWNDFATYLGDLEGDDVVASTDVSPVVLIAADVVSLIFLNAGGVITGVGVDREELRITLLRQTPFLTTHTGPLRLTPQMQRSQMPYVVVGVVKQGSRPPLTSGVWVAKTTIEFAEVGKRFLISKTPGAPVVPSRALLPSHATRPKHRSLRALKEVLNNKDPFEGDVSVYRESDNMFESYDGNKGTTLDSQYSSQQPVDTNMPFPRRLTEGKFSQVLVRSVIGDARLAFQPSGWAARKCLRQIERTLTIAEIAESGKAGFVPVCATSQTGFVLSFVDQSESLSGSIFSDFMNCSQEKLMLAAEEAMRQIDPAIISVDRRGDENTLSTNCVASQATFSQTVGVTAMWGEDVCARETGLPSLGEAYKSVHSSLFVTSGPAKPLLELPGLLRAYIQEQGNTTWTPNVPNLLDSIDLTDHQYISHVRGEDWACACGSAGTEVTCVQLYRVMECPIFKEGGLYLETDCCVLPEEAVSCESSDPITCSNAIVEYMNARDAMLASRKTQIALHPKEAFEGYRPDVLLGNSTSSEFPFLADFELSECVLSDIATGSMGATEEGIDAQEVFSSSEREPLHQSDVETKDSEMGVSDSSSGRWYAGSLTLLALSVFVSLAVDLLY